MADFSADKQTLQQTLAVFDTDIKVEDVVEYSPKYGPCKSTDMLFLQTILEVCCSFVEPNPNQRKHLFTVLEALLVREKIISPNVRFESLTDIRRKAAKQFIVSLNGLRTSLIPSPKDSISIPKLLDVDYAIKYPNTYEENFVEISVIAEGGFGTVCKARHKVDGLIYAVKKIIFNVESEKDFIKVMAEVKSISTLSHKNIVSYKNCWIQLPCNLEEKTGVAEEDSSGSLHSISRKFDGIRLRQRKRKPKCVAPLNFVQNATSSPCYKNPKSSEESLLSRVLNSAPKRRVSMSFCTNRSSSSSSLHDQSIDIFYKSESDSSIVCDPPSSDHAQGLVPAGPDIIITDSASNNATASVEQKTKLDQRNFWDTSSAQIASLFDRLPTMSEKDLNVVWDSPCGLTQGLVPAGPDIIKTDSASNNATASAEHKTKLDQRNLRNTSSAQLASLSDRLPTISEKDSNVVWDSPCSLAQGLVPAGPNIIITDSTSIDSSVSADSWLSRSEHDESKLDQGNFWNTSSSSSDSESKKLVSESSLSSPFTGSRVSNSLHAQTLGSDEWMLFSDSYRNDSSHDQVSECNASNSQLSESDDETLSPDSTDSDPDDHEVSSKPEKRTQGDSSWNDSASVGISVTVNEEFSERVAVSRCNTSCVTSWSAVNPRRSRLNDSIICYDSNKAATLEYPFKFKSKVRPMLCIQMEYCDCDLRLWMDQRNKGDRLPFEKDIKDIFKEIVEGVAYIHSKSIIHRDLKPQNIFYSEKDHAMKIGDFGLAALGHSSPNRHKAVNQHFTSCLGTLPYAAPEQMKKHDYNNKVDIYSLGIILIELLLPFHTRSEFYRTIDQILRGDMPKELTSQWPSYVKLVENLVQKRPTLRMAAKEILDLPVMENDTEVDRRSLIREIEDLKKALENKDKEFEDALNEKNVIIESLRLEIKELRSVVKNLKSKKSRKKH